MIPEPEGYHDTPRQDYHYDLRSGGWTARLIEHWDDGPCCDGWWTIRLSNIDTCDEAAPLLDYDTAKSLLQVLRAAIHEIELSMQAAAPEDAECHLDLKSIGVERVYRELE